jgi:cysteine synthase
VLELIGDTPMVKLSKVAPRELSVFVKAEYLNPSGSLKDRIALTMIRDAEVRGSSATPPTPRPTSGQVKRSMSNWRVRWMHSWLR